jgi:DNA-binding MarR family transcriptional regulator
MAILLRAGCTCIAWSVETSQMTKKQVPAIGHSTGGRLFTDLVLEIFRFNGQLVFVGDQMTRSLGLSTARWQILGAIALAEAPLTVAEIARNMGLQRQSVQRTVDVLVNADMVVTQENPNHQRARLVVFTPKGRAAYAQAIAIQTGWANKTAATVQEARLRSALLTLRMLRESLEPESRQKR